jgi:1-acyl-sn-glycerol-3-phosphate acyltransferase
LLVPFVAGAYRTAPRRISLVARAFPTCTFFLNFAAIVFRAASVAKRGKYRGREWSESSLEVMHALESVGCQFEITGAEHLMGLDGPCVIVGNHMSTLETAILPVVIQPIREVTFVVKQSLVDYPVFKHVMRSRNPIAIAQTNPREDLKTMLVEGAERLSRGVSVVVFPEGSRLGAFDPANFNTIGVKLASRAGVPVVPLALKTDAWAVGRPLPDVGRIDPRKKVRIAFGEPLHVAGRGTVEQQAIIDFIRSRLAEWQAEDSSPPSAPGSARG